MRRSVKIVVTLALISLGFAGLPAPAQATSAWEGTCRSTPAGNMTYASSYVLGPSSDIDARSVQEMLSSRFAEIFQGDGSIIAGSPAEMPRNGESIALHIAGLGRFDVVLRDQWYLPQRNNFGWRFESAPGSVDPAPSSTVFDFFDRYDGAFVMTVNASISGRTCASPYLEAVFGAWRSVSDRIARASAAS